MFGWSQLRFCCERRQRKGGLTSIATPPANRCWKEGGFRKDFSILVGQMKVSAKHVTKRKAQKSSGSTIAQNGTRSDVRSQRLSESGSTKRELRRRSGSGKEALLRILSVNASGTGIISVGKSWSLKSIRAGAPAEGFKGHVATDGSLLGTAGK